MEISLTTSVLLVAAIWSIICRIRHMAPGVTRPAVFAQHALLSLALFAALLLPPATSELVMSGGVLLFLAFGSRRWRWGAPPGTQRQEANADPLEIDPAAWKRISGGKKQ